MDNLRDAPALGSSEAAVRSAVNLIARAAGADETQLAYWLDMYFQLRSAFEASRERTKAMDDEPGTALAVAPPDVERTAEGAPSPAEEKTRIRERFLAARREGITLDSIREHTNYRVSEDDLRNIRESRKVSLVKYRLIDKALDELEEAKDELEKVLSDPNKT